MAARIGIDCRFAAAAAGLGRYTRSIVTELLHRSDGFEYVLFVRSKAEEWLRSISGAQLVTADFDHYTFGEQISFPKLIRSQKLLLLFSPHFNVPLNTTVPTVVTIHDLILHRYPNQSPFHKRIAYRLVFDRAVRRARRIIAVSEFTKNELAATYGESVTAKTNVILEGVEPLFRPMSSPIIEETKRRYDISGPYFLYLGNAKEHKNVPVLLAAFTRCSRTDCSLILICGGKETSGLQLPPRARLLANVPDDDLPALLSGTEALVTASLYEGFYLPGAEARACGARIIATRRGAIPEVVQDQGLLVEPTVEALAQAMSAVSDLPRPTPPPFSWQKAAAQTAALLQGALTEIR